MGKKNKDRCFIVRAQNDKDLISGLKYKKDNHFGKEILLLLFK